jgi:pyruvate kinase
MAARDDLYLQLGAARVAVLEALEQIVAADPEAIVASRILGTLETEAAPALADLADVALMARMGYRTFMFGDGLCFGERAFDRAVAAFVELEAWLASRR